MRIFKISLTSLIAVVIQEGLLHQEILFEIGSPALKNADHFCQPDE